MKSLLTFLYRLGRTVVVLLTLFLLLYASLSFVAFVLLILMFIGLGICAVNRAKMEGWSTHET